MDSTVFCRVVCLRVSPMQPRGGSGGLRDRGKVYRRHVRLAIVPTTRSRFALNNWDARCLLTRAADADDPARSSCDGQLSERVKAKASFVFDKDRGRLLPASLRYVCIPRCTYIHSMSAKRIVFGGMMWQASFTGLLHHERLILHCFQNASRFCTSFN